MGTLHNDLLTFMLSRSFLLSTKNLSDKSYRENQNTFYVPYLFFFLSKIMPFMRCEKIRSSQPAGQCPYDNIIWIMGFPCWITNATNIHSEYVILTAFQQQPRLRERATMLYVHCMSCYRFIWTNVFWKAQFVKSLGVNILLSTVTNITH
jgi:hypothetical protein